MVHELGKVSYNTATFQGRTLDRKCFKILTSVCSCIKVSSSVLSLNTILRMDLNDVSIIQDSLHPCDISV